MRCRCIRALNASSERAHKIKDGHSILTLTGPLGWIDENPRLVYSIDFCPCFSSSFFFEAEIFCIYLSTRKRFMLLIGQ